MTPNIIDIFHIIFIIIFISIISYVYIHNDLKLAKYFLYVLAGIITLELLLFYYYRILYNKSHCEIGKQLMCIKN